MAPASLGPPNLCLLPRDNCIARAAQSEHGASLGDELCQRNVIAANVVGVRAQSDEFGLRHLWTRDGKRHR